MGKAPSPSKKGSGHIGSRALSATRSDSGSAAFDDADGGVTSTPPRVESTIVSRETATHLAFAKSRKEDFVYAPTSHYFHILNDHCQWDHEVRSALLAVVGQPGDGKSALLANWAEERRRSVKGERELIYEHYCGCSYDSVKLSLFLFRFMNQLKISYSLRDFELPREHEEEKLKFSFSRCLEAAVGKGEHTTGSASKRKRIILVLDGIDCIRTEDGGDSLSWLPNTFPAGVRIIVSSTQIGAKGKSHFRRCQKIVRQPAVYDSDGDLIYETTLPPRDKESHTIRELRRRNAAFMVAEPLDEVSCSAILEMYEQRFSRELDPEEKQLIVAARGSSSPLYVRLLLNGLELFDPSESDQRHQWLEQACESNQLNCVYELLMKQWNAILLKDLFAELLERTALLEAAASNSSNGGAPLFTSDRSGVDQNGGVRNSIKSAPVELSGANNNNGLSSKLNAANNPIDIGDIESLQVTIEQRSLLVRHTLSLLAVSRYGLSENDFVRLFGESISRSICQRLLTLLKPHLMTIRRYDCGPGSQNPGSSISASVGNSNKESGNQDNGGEPVVLYDLSHNQLRILTRYGFLLDDQLRGCYYRELAVYFEAMEACQRRVDELPVQLERCSMWGVLQSSLVNMKMFQLWWTERNRQEFFFYWIVLSSNCSMHDPVDDFIRSLDEYIAQESPSMEQLMSIFLTITDFLRAWQKIDESRVVNLVLNRPKPPQLQEFLASLGTFSTSNLSESEAERVQKEIEALVIHPDDGYYVRRWLWTQFPLIGTAFESRVFRSTGSSRTPADGDCTSGTRDESLGSECSGPGDKAFSTKTGAAKKALNNPVGVVVLPKGIVKAKKTLVPTKRRRQHKVSTSLALESVTEEIGALEFLSAETGEGSVSKLESQLMELRMKYDRMKFLAREKNEALKSVESRVQDAKAEITAAGQSATQIDDLLENIRNVNDEATLGRQRSEYYKLILRHCELNPARDPKTIETAETTVAKLKREIVDLQQKTQVVSYEKRLASLDVPKLAQVTQDKASIHQEALSRLRWRQELDRRLYYASLSTKDSGQITLKASATVSNASPKKDPPHSSSAHSKSTRNSVTFTADDSTQTAPVDPNFFRAKDKLIHMKETSLARQKNAENLQLYVGSAYKDDGILGALRQVGINKPEEALLCWQNQLDHSVQLEEEEKQAEQRVLEYREKLELLQTQFVNLKLSGSSSGRVEGSTEDDASSANGDDEAAASKTSVNVKMLEKQLADVKAVKQKKKERVARLRSLHEKLQLGLLHIAQLLGVTSVQQLNALEIVDSIEKVVRVVLGDEAHLQAAPSPSFRHKNSTRMVNVPGQTGDSMGLLSDTRSDNDKVRYNIRVSRSEKRQMNPYVDAEFDDDEHEDDFDEDDGDDHEDAGNNAEHSDDHEDAGNNAEHSDDREGSPGKVRASSAHNDTNTVKKRRDIKNRSKLELEKKRAAQKKKTKD